MPPVRIPVSVVFVKMADVTFVFVRIAFVKLAPERSTPERSMPVRFWFERFAPRRTTRGPTMNPLREKYPVGRVAVSRPVILPVIIPERLVDAPLISVFVKFAPVSVIPPVRSMFWRTSDERFTAGPTMVPVLPVLVREKYPAGSRVAVAVPPVRPKERRPVTVAPERSTPLISILKSDALVRLAEVRRVRVRSAIPAPDISRFESAALESLTAGPTMKLLYII
jgi:hypothetical protein